MCVSVCIVKLHTRKYAMYRHTDQFRHTGTLQRHLPLRMFLSVGRNVIFRNKEVIVYFFLAILWQELDISCFLLPCSNYSLYAEGTSKAECFLIPRRLVLSHGDTHTERGVTFLSDIGKLANAIFQIQLCNSIKTTLAFPWLQNTSSSCRVQNKKTVECFCHWDFNKILKRTKQKHATAEKLHRQYLGESCFLYFRKGYW